VDLPTLEYYFYGDICVCTTVRQAMAIKQFKKIGQYLHLNEEQRPEPTGNNYNILYKAISALDIIKKLKEYYFQSSDLAVDEAMIGFKGRFHLK
jgi:hypothetical protein